MHSPSLARHDGLLECPTEKDEPPVLEAPPPDGGYGWVCVLSCFLINCFTWGVTASYGVYLAHFLSANIFTDSTPLDFAIIGGMNFSMAMLVAPLATIIARRYGTKAPMFIGVILVTTGFVSASFSSKIWQLYLSQGVLVGLGGGLTYIPSIAVVSQWFRKKRSLANGITSAGSGVGGLIFSFATEAMINKISLAWSFRITGIIVCIATLIATVLIRNRNETIKPQQRPFDTKLLRRYDVMLLLAWSFITMLGYLAVLFSLSDYGRSIGLSSSQAAAVSAFCNLGTAIGRPLIGIASDRYGRMETAGILTLICGVSCLAIWIPAKSYGMLVFFALSNGANLGIFYVAIGPLCVEVAGLVELPSLLSLSWLSTVLPATFSEVIGLELRRPNSAQPYLHAQIFTGIAYIVASVCMYELWRVKRRQRMIENKT